MDEEITATADLAPDVVIAELKKLIFLKSAAAYGIHSIVEEVRRLSSLPPPDNDDGPPEAA